MRLCGKVFRITSILSKPMLYSFVNPFPKDKLKEFANDNFNFDENGRMFSKHVENTVGKGEISCHEQFLLFPQYFLKTCTSDTKNQGLFGKELRV